MGRDAPLFTTLLAADSNAATTGSTASPQAFPKLPNVVFLLADIAIGPCLLAVGSPWSSPMRITALSVAAVVLFAAVLLSPAWTGPTPAR